MRKKNFKNNISFEIVNKKFFSFYKKNFNNFVLVTRTTNKNRLLTWKI